MTSGREWLQSIQKNKEEIRVKQLKDELWIIEFWRNLQQWIACVSQRREKRFQRNAEWYRVFLPSSQFCAALFFLRRIPAISRLIWSIDQRMSAFSYATFSPWKFESGKSRSQKEWKSKTGNDACVKIRNENGTYLFPRTSRHELLSISQTYEYVVGKRSIFGEKKKRHRWARTARQTKNAAFTSKRR